MATFNNKRIEETAVNALKGELLRCEVLDSFIDSNDRTPSWDGTVFIYNDKTRKKANLIGRAPIQVKGTGAAIVSDTASFSCNVADLRNYYNDGGCVFFLISVDTSTGTANIYYSALHVFDLKRMLDNAGQQKSISIILNKFPHNNPSEVISIFLNFIADSRKQTSFIGKELGSLEQLESNGASIESLSFGASGIGPNKDSLGKYLSTHDFYLYAKPKGVDIEIPIKKISNATIIIPVIGKVMVKEKEYYASYKVLHEKGIPIICVGKGIRMSWDDQNDRLVLQFKIKGTLSDVIHNTSCIVAMLENHEITLGGVKLPLDGVPENILIKYKKSLQYQKDVKKTLDLLGVTEELCCEDLSEKDEIILRNSVYAMLYNKGIDFPNATDNTIHGAFRIANLAILIWATRQSDGYYKLESFFEKRNTVAFANDDIIQSNPIPVSQFLLLDKENFIHTSNMDYEAIEKDIRKMPHHPLLTDNTTRLLLNVLRGYDEQKEKDLRLLDLAETICDWLDSNEETGSSSIVLLNRLQIKKRKRSLSAQETSELVKLTDEKPSTIRCGAYLLLDDINKAQLCFDELPKGAQKEFLAFPICHFGRLIPKGD